MRHLALVLLVACGHPPPATDPGLPAPRLPRLPPPAPIDARAPGAAYLTSVALQLQPGWGQFLDDCRLRLPVRHALNQMGLAATAVLAIDEHGAVTTVDVESSGNRDFDRAVRDAIIDAAPLPPPPRELLSDDDVLHVRWLFARDRRQAGPATARLFEIEQPLAEVVARRIARGDLERAARRILGAPATDATRRDATRQLMIAALAEALDASDTAVQLAALDAIRRASVVELMPAVRAKLAAHDRDVRLAAIHASRAVDDADARASLLAQLGRDLVEDPEVALVELRALAAAGGDDHVAIIAAYADRTPTPPPAAIPALAVLPLVDLTRRTTKLWDRGDARTRAAVCDAIGWRRKMLGRATGAAGGDAFTSRVELGLRERDAVVRASCVRAAASLDQPAASIVQRLRELARDRDASVRARAVAAVLAFDARTFVHAAGDRSAEVRAAYAQALAHAEPAHAEQDLADLLDDRDADVRAAAWTSYARLATSPADRAQLAARAVHDNAPQVRAAAVHAVTDEELLAHVAASDDAAEVRTAALVEVALRRRSAAIDPLLAQLAAAPPASLERVRIALAGLLAL